MAKDEADAAPMTEERPSIAKSEAIAAMGSDVTEPVQEEGQTNAEEDYLVNRERADEARRRERLKNDSDEQDMGERKRYATHAYSITQAWVGFLIVVTIAQMALKPWEMNLETAEYIAFVTTTTASVFGFWLLVGNYLFRKPKE